METKIKIYKKYLSISDRISLRVHALLNSNESYEYEHDFMKKIYDLRSELIHFGRKEKITTQNILALRRILSASMIAYIKWKQENPNKNHYDFINYLSTNFENYLNELIEYRKK